MHLKHLKTLQLQRREELTSLFKDVGDAGGGATRDCSLDHFVGTDWRYTACNITIGDTALSGRADGAVKTRNKLVKLGGKSSVFSCPYPGQSSNNNSLKFSFFPQIGSSL